MKHKIVSLFSYTKKGHFKHHKKMREAQCFKRICLELKEIEQKGREQPIGKQKKTNLKLTQPVQKEKYKQNETKSQKNGENVK